MRTNQEQVPSAGRWLAVFVVFAGLFLALAVVAPPEPGVSVAPTDPGWVDVAGVFGLGLAAALIVALSLRRPGAGAD